MFLAFHHYDVRCKSIVYGLYYIEVYSPYNHFLEGFYHKLVLNFVKSFFCIYWGDHVVFILQLVNLYYTDCSYILKNPCIPGINLTWTCYMILLMYCWIWFASILLRVFAFMFTRTLTPVGKPLWYNSVIRFFFSSLWVAHLPTIVKAPILSSCCGFGFAFGCRTYFLVVSGLFIDGCSAASCDFVFSWVEGGSSSTLPSYLPSSLLWYSQIFFANQLLQKNGWTL